MRLTLNISTCPNDTFMFDALIHRRIDTQGLEFDVRLTDIEELNRAALEESVDISKISYAALPALADRYRVLNSGSALGRGNGPLLVSSKVLTSDELEHETIAIPGRNTTANLLLEQLFPTLQKKQVYLFSEITEALVAQKCGAGVLIHEGRFTYAQAGLNLIADLGVRWEKETGLPLPLGAIVVSRELDRSLQRSIERLVQQSIEYGFAHPGASAEFVGQHAKELTPKVIEQHIELFVNDFSLDLGEQGRRAVKVLLGLKDEEVFV